MVQHAAQNGHVVYLFILHSAQNIQCWHVCGLWSHISILLGNMHYLVHRFGSLTNGILCKRTRLRVIYFIFHYCSVTVPATSLLGLS